MWEEEINGVKFIQPCLQCKFALLTLHHSQENKINYYGSSFLVGHPPCIDVNGLRTIVIPEADFQVLISSSEFPVLNHKDKPSTMIKPFNEMTRIGNKMAMCNIKLFSLLI